MEPGLKTIVLY